MKDSLVKNAAYGVLDLITLRKGVARKINDISVRFPARWYRYFPGDYEKENYDLLKQCLKPGMDVIDIGAHIGLFSVVCSLLTQNNGKIVCFEPTPGTYQLLLQTLKLNHCKNVTPVQAAVSNKLGNATFYISNENEGNNSNSLVENNPYQQMSGYDVRLETIDNIIETYSLVPSIIKIDVEGAEFDTLRGGLASFLRFRPRLILGLHPAAINRKGDNLEMIWNLLTSVPYNIELDGKAMTKEDFCSRDILFDVHCF